MSQHKRAKGIAALTAACLIFIPSAVLAIGDSGGCSSPSVERSPILRAAIEGTPDDIKKELEAAVIRSEQFVDKKANARIWSDPALQASWRAGKLIGFINSPLACSTGEWILDYAVAAGNIRVVHWLLESGTNPTAPSPSGYVDDRTTIFSRCIDSPLSTYPGIFKTKPELKKRLEALDLVIEHGGNIELAGFNGENALHRCKNTDILRYYLSKKVNLSPPVRPRLKYSPLQFAISAALSARMNGSEIERLRAFADAGANDIRGLSIERKLRTQCAEPKQYEVCSVIAQLVRSTSGTFPSINYKSNPGKLDKSEFSLYREWCSFPEIKYLSNYLSIGVFVDRAWLLPKTDIKFSANLSEAQQVNLVVNSPNLPIFILLSYHSGPLIWNIFRTDKTEILGIAVAGNTDAPQVVAGLDQPTPVIGDYFSGANNPCGDIRQQTSQKPEFNYYFGERDLNPFAVRLDKIYPVIGPSVVIGNTPRPDEPLLHSFTSTPESFRNSGEPWSGQLGLENLVKAGVLRLATSHDIATWEKQTRKRPPLASTYVVMGGFKFPSGLYGINATNFIVPKGVPSPVGDPGQSSIYYFDGFKCLGASCYQ